MKTNSALLTEQADRNISFILLFSFTLFISAALMFVLQPMFGKILLPLLGGSPSVWNTCMVFYQTVLFLGYFYAHYISTHLTQHKQILTHVCLVLISLFALPLALPENTSPPIANDPTLWLLWILFLAIGLPFFTVSTTSPLLQKWFANIGHHTSHDPYYLYAASNAGSLLALLSYPFLIEPNIGLQNQKTYWSAGYVLLCIIISACAILLRRSRQQQHPEHQNAKVKELTLIIRLRWLVLAFVPSSLLLGLTNFISTDIASVPLLWIIPLTLYLLSFIIVFSKWGRSIHSVMVFLQPVVLVPFIAYSFINPATLPYWLDLILHLLSFFLAVMVCHGELAKSRPHTEHLTSFYLILSFAGMLGGMFNTFVAPFIFNAVYEYPIMIIAALLLRPGQPRKNINIRTQFAKDAGFPLVLLCCGLILFASVDLDTLRQNFDSIGVILILLAGLNYSFRTRPVSLAFLTAVIIFFILGLRQQLSNTIYHERTFFGVSWVRLSTLINEQKQAEQYHELYHGTTKHGAQRLPTEYRQTPLSYYSRPGPMGQLFKEFDSTNQDWDVGVVGLGAGALACYAKTKQHWTFYELDPTVIKIARNPKFFNYLNLCSKKSSIIIGDARLSLTNEPDNKFDLLVIDAFSSDSIPTHLLTREALQLYFSKLKANGLLSFHITNRHLSLKKVLSDHAKHLKLAALIQEFIPHKKIPLVVETDWVVFARDPKILDPLKNSRFGSWQKLPLYFDLKPWTDDFTNIFNIWKN